MNNTNEKIWRRFAWSLGKNSLPEKPGNQRFIFQSLERCPFITQIRCKILSSHIDITLGESPEKDLEWLRHENPADPATWVWTTADQKFISVIEKLHEEGVRVILDFSWNHTGTSFWAFSDLKNNLQNSFYKDWYEVDIVDDPETGKPQLCYEGWLSVKSIPELNKVNTEGKIPGHPYKGDVHPDAKKHIFHVTRRWMDPNQDGKFGDGIDGMRLDVAEHVPVGFLERFQEIYQIN